jgi:hypothetical protein
MRDPALADHEPVALAGRGGDHRDDRLVERHGSGRAVKDRIAERKNSSVGGDERASDGASLALLLAAGAANRGRPTTRLAGRKAPGEEETLMRKFRWQDYVIVPLIGIAIAGCSVNTDDVTVTPGTAIYVTAKRTPSDQLLWLKNAACAGSGSCMLSVMKLFKPTFSLFTIHIPLLNKDISVGQAEYDEILNTKRGDEFAAALDGVLRSKDCIRVKFWKSVGGSLWDPKIYDHAEWSHTSKDCFTGGNLLD